MEQTYWLGRMRASKLMARNASNAEARLIHYELAGRYSVMAAGPRRTLLEVIDSPPLAENARNN